MRAWIVASFGTPSLVEMPDPVAGPGDVVLDVRSVAINFRDHLMMRGQYDPRQKLPLVLGSDAVGIVREVGPGVAGLAIGDRVCPTFHSAWLRGPLEEIARRGTLGGPRPGVFAERVAIRAAACVRTPAHLSDDEAATLPCAGVTAWRALDEGNVRAGSTVLALGTGGVSMFAVQLARLRGARAFVTSSDDGRIARAVALGAEAGINYRADPQWGKTIVERTGGVDLVVEVGGAGTLGESLRACKTGGTVALVGNLAGVDATIPLTRIFMRGIRMQGILVGSRDDQAALFAALEAHPDVRPVIASVHPFEELGEALERFPEGGHFGKVVVRVQS
jgi:NADPH:quinone reductase-like Zn-dependent oxidoreductase